MGLLQQAYETYNQMEHLAGADISGKEMLAPVGHLVTRADLEIVLDAGGQYLSARAVEKDEPKIAIPATEQSASRTVQPHPHPLSDQLGYLAGFDAAKHRAYLDQLTDWASSEYGDAKLRAVLAYLQGGTILTDLANAGLIRLDEAGRPDNEKLLVRWTVNGLGPERSGPCWTDPVLFHQYIQYDAARRNAGPGGPGQPSEERPAAPGPDADLCMVSGQWERPASLHPKGIVAANGNAKLISANDSSGFTYRGRFDSPSQAASVGYTASQKAHNALRWLVANEGVRAGKRTFLCWNPQGIPLPPVTESMRRRGREPAERAAKPTEYRQQLQRALSGWRDTLPADAGAVVAAFDAATSGRLALTYYSELPASDLLQRMADWEATLCWENGRFGIQSPTLSQLVNWAFGAPRNGRPEADGRILGGQVQRLVACRVGQALFPLDIERALVERASDLIVYEAGMRAELLFTACAAIRKYHLDHSKEEWTMGLDRENTDRSYLFGRLLAVCESIERSTYGPGEERETNAMRMQKAFAQRPMAGWRMLQEKLEPYFRQLKPGLREYYRRLTEEITDKLPASPELLNQKLDDVYLLGYYHQRAWRPGSPDKHTETTEE